MRYLWTAMFFSLGIALIICAALSFPCVPGNLPESEGKNLFATNCLSCHSSSGPASILNPGTLSRNEWAQFFQEGIHLGEPLSEMVDMESLESIKRYCMQIP